MQNGMYEDSVVQLCSDYAAVAHIGQFRKDRITPYISHPARVAGYASGSYFNSSYIEMAAAWLHDVLEDCTDIDDPFIVQNHKTRHKDIRLFLLDNPRIKQEDGRKILKIVELLTMSQDASISKKTRKQSYLKKIKNGCSSAIFLKYCDRMDNLTTVHHFSKKGFSNYIQDTEILIEKLSDRFDNISFVLKYRLDNKLEEVRKKYNEMYP